MYFFNRGHKLDRLMRLFSNKRFCFHVVLSSKYFIHEPFYDLKSNSRFYCLEERRHNINDFENMCNENVLPIIQQIITETLDMSQ